MRRSLRGCLWPALVFIVAASAVGPLEVGKPLPPLVLGHPPQNSRLDRMTQDGPVTLLWRKAPISEDDCETLEKANSRLAGDRLRLIVLSTGKHPCSEKAQHIFQVQPSEIAIPDGSGSSWFLAIADPYGIVRVVRSLSRGRAGIEQATTIATDWEGGRQSFITNCGHCHGNDGADLSYAGIKTLAGISRRMTGEQILEGGQQAGAVDMTAWSQSAKDALLLYIAGL
jgi:cytochrome c553